MGIYINPNTTSKEEFLAANCSVISKGKFTEFNFDNHPNVLPIALVDNGGFTAAAVAYCSEERDVFAGDISGRSMSFYIINKAKLNKAAGLSDHEIAMINA